MANLCASLFTSKISLLYFTAKSLLPKISFGLCLSSFSTETTGIAIFNLLKIAFVTLICAVPPSTAIKLGYVHSVCFRRFSSTSARAPVSFAPDCVLILNFFVFTLCNFPILQNRHHSHHIFTTHVGYVISL